MARHIKPHFEPPVEFPGEISQAFNLSPEETADGWTQAEERSRAAQDRAEAARRQVDMFPDCDLNQPKPEPRQEGRQT